MTQAFLAALDDIPGAQQEAVAKAALVALKDQLQLRRQKVKRLNALARGTANSRPALPPAARTRKARLSAT